ncbi:hypothetical protein GEMRC1_011220 [Eukaryota sp. GEM-RC1]
MSARLPRIHPSYLTPLAQSARPSGSARTCSTLIANSLSQQEGSLKQFFSRSLSRADLQHLHRFQLSKTPLERYQQICEDDLLATDVPPLTTGAQTDRARTTTNVSEILTSARLSSRDPKSACPPSPYTRSLTSGAISSRKPNPGGVKPSSSVEVSDDSSEVFLPTNVLSVSCTVNSSKSGKSNPNIRRKSGTVEETVVDDKTESVSENLNVVENTETLEEPIVDDKSEFLSENLNVVENTETVEEPVVDDKSELLPENLNVVENTETVEEPVVDDKSELLPENLNVVENTETVEEPVVDDKSEFLSENLNVVENTETVEEPVVDDKSEFLSENLNVVENTETVEEPVVDDKSELLSENLNVVENTETVEETVVPNLYKSDSDFDDTVPQVIHASDTSIDYEDDFE